MKPRAFRCDICKNRIQYEELIPVRKPTPVSGLFEIGLECPRCKTFYFSGYIDSNLFVKQKAVEISTGKEKVRLGSEFTREFLAFQEVAKSKLNAPITVPTAP